MAFAPMHIRRAVDRRVLLVLFIINLLAQVDRTNLTFGSLGIISHLNLSSSAYGFGAGIFFLGVAVATVPQTFIFQRIRPHTWLACMMALWAVASLLTAFVQSVAEFDLVRFMLGVSEAALVPAAVTCLARFYTPREVGSAAANFVAGGAVAAAIGAPVASLILKLNGGLESWQWLFVLQAIPVLLLATVIPRLLPQAPAEATWLTSAESDWLTEHTVNRVWPGRQSPRQLLSALVSPKVGVLIVVYFAINLALWGLTFWLPQLVHTSFPSLDSSQVALVSGIAFVGGAAGMYGFGKLSRATGDRRTILLGVLAAAAVFLVMSLQVTGRVGPLIFIALGLAASFSAIAVFNGVLATAFTGPRSATPIGFVNGVGLLGGFLGPYMFGWLKDATGATTDSLYIYAAVFAVAIIAVFAARQYFAPVPRGDEALWEPDVPEASAPPERAAR